MFGEKHDEILNEIVTDFGHDEVIVSDSDIEMMLIVPYEKQKVRLYIVLTSIVSLLMINFPI